MGNPDVISMLKGLEERIKNIERWQFPPSPGAWVDYSSGSTVVGWSASGLTKLIFYQKIGKMVIVNFRISGTSNATGSTFTLPDAVGNYVRANTAIRAEDNGAWAAGWLEMVESGGTVYLYPGMAGGTWTATGGKSAMGQFFYHLD